MNTQLDLSDIKMATTGNFLVEGFVSPSIQAILPERRVFGSAMTWRLPGDDGAALVDVLSIAKPGQVIVINRCGDLRPANRGAVTTTAAIERGVVGAVIDGVMTDRSAFIECGFPVWCRGRSPITTKFHGMSGDVSVPINCGATPGTVIICMQTSSWLAARFTRRSSSR